MLRVNPFNHKKKKNCEKIFFFEMLSPKGRHDTRPNDTQHNSIHLKDSQYYENQHGNKKMRYSA
jgi:hypothetical protein